MAMSAAGEGWSAKTSAVKTGCRELSDVALRINRCGVGGYSCKMAKWCSRGRHPSSHRVRFSARRWSPAASARRRRLAHEQVFHGGVWRVDYLGLGLVDCGVLWSARPKCVMFSWLVAAPGPCGRYFLCGCSAGVSVGCAGRRDARRSLVRLPQAPRPKSSVLSLRWGFTGVSRPAPGASTSVY